MHFFKLVVGHRGVLKQGRDTVKYKREEGLSVGVVSSTSVSNPSENEGRPFCSSVATSSFCLVCVSALVVRLSQLWKACEVRFSFH